MEIGKTVVTGGADLAKLYGQKTDTSESREAQAERGESPQPASVAKGGGAAAAMVEISPEALERSERQEALHLARETYADLPDTRENVVADVKQRLAEGYYETEAVREQLTDRLVNLARSWRDGSS